MFSLANHLENREHIIEALKEDVIGPTSIKENMIPFSTIGNLTLESKEEFYKRYYQKETKEEIIQRNNPSAHYIAGMLYPYPEVDKNQNELELNDEINMFDDEIKTEDLTISENAKKQIKNSQTEIEKMKQDDEGDLVPQKSEYLPSSLGISFYIKTNNKGKINFDITGGRYLQQTVNARETNYKQTWWFRKRVEINQAIEVRQLEKYNRKLFSLNLQSENTKDMDLQLSIFSRKIEEGFYLITASLTNRTKISTKAADRDKYALFQAEMSVSLEEAEFFPYPHKEMGIEDKEEKSNLLLYRKSEIYGLGHNCSCDWVVDQSEKVIKVFSTFLPRYETKSMTPNISDENGTPFSVPMFELTGKTCGIEKSKQILTRVVNLYEKWIDEKEKTIDNIQDSLKGTAREHMKKCRESLMRMKKGISLLDDKKIAKAFQLANQAMILQQVNGNKIRKGLVKNDKVHFEEDISILTFDNIDALRKTGKGNWRAFQIAFILMALESTIKGESPDRELVDLIWFPTGGGKTEAYLGLAAISMFYRRIVNREDTGTEILMRYTLRLLTADQFQRSSRLICAMEYIRREEQNLLGDTPFTIGIWLGGDTTPNTNKQAISQLNSLQLNGKEDDFILSYCPWCGAALGKYEGDKKKSKKSVYHGYKNQDKELVIHCPDSRCEFFHQLPIYIVDETIYKIRPTFLLGTIDKFAMLAWRPQARSLFGLDENGNRIFSPPNLIIQDELHLISGPLGTISGLYEALIEDLCTDFRKGENKKPKIVCATATIRRYEEQIRNLYGRKNSRLFPSPGLEHDDSFFAQTAKDEEGKDMPGRLYVGIYSPTVQLMTMQVKVFSTLLQCVKELPEEEQDPFYTLLSFYNSIRELGGGLTLTQTDIPNYFNQIRFKRAIDNKEQYRWLNNVLELTSRLKSGEVSSAIQKLKKEKNERDVIDICLASNIIEVGVDIDRLSLMTIVGQPKTTAQYIQVSGRVGRKWAERPGLIISLFANGRSRDKSHFEHFREYHERLYSQVEPTSVTPFSDPSIKKALAAIIIAFLRQTQDQRIAESPEYVKDYLKELEGFKQRLLKRVEFIDPLQMEVVSNEFDKFIRKISKNYLLWEIEKDNPNIAVMYSAGDYINDEQRRLGTPVMRSMRSVDAQCVGTISALYMDIQEDDF